MQSAVERILNENFNTDSHTLSFSAPMIEISVKEGDSYEGSFDIIGPDDEYVEGWVSATNMRLSLPVSEFSGSSPSIPYLVNIAGLAEGDSLKGDFRIISNKGEYLLPFEIHINNEEIDTSLGDIKNLFHFTNLARNNWSEAVSIFKSNSFEKILSGADRQYLEAYRAVKDGRDSSQCLEEFLLYVKKKQPVSFIAEEMEVRNDSVLKDVTRDVVIRRNGWGYSDLEISKDGNFLVVESDAVSDEDFVENLCRIRYTIVDSALHAGRNFGSITFKNPYQTFTVTITAIKNPISRQISDQSRKTKHLTLDLMRYYEAFRTRKITASTWMEETAKIIDELKAINPRELSYELMNVQLLITQERYNEARWILEQNESRAAQNQDPSISCYYYYLTTLLNRNEDYTVQVTDLVERRYSDNRGRWRIAWLLLYLKEEYARNPQLRWEMLENQFDQGVASPVLCVEAYQILLNNPTILNRMGSFENQILNYMAKRDLLTADVIEQVIYVLGRQKNYDLRLLPMLRACYKVCPTDEVLKAICSLLINANATDRKAHEWYEKGVERTLRITKLYEYFMNSLDLETAVELPKAVVMYFAFDSSLDVQRNSFLYSYVYRNKALMSELYENYREAIERFVCFQLLNGRNNKYLAYLYRNIITPVMITEDVAKGLSKALFVHTLRPLRKNIVEVSIYYPYLYSEYTFKISGQEEAYIPLYGNECRIVLVDEWGNRFVGEEEYVLEKLMTPDKLALSLQGLVKDDLLFDLWICRKDRGLGEISDQNLDSMQRISCHPAVLSSVRKNIRAKLLSYYYNKELFTNLDELLEELTPEKMTADTMNEAIQYMVIRGKYEKAYEWVGLWSGENTDPRIIVRLCTRILSLDAMEGKEEENPIMTGLSYRAFIYGKYDEGLLNYLLRYFKGASKEMREIWKVAGEWGLDLYDFEQRLLEQMLYTNAFVSGAEKIFTHFASRGVNKRLIMAFLAQKCYDFFVCDSVEIPQYAEVLQKCIEDEYDIPFVCKLAYTKYYSSRVRSLDEKISRTLVVFLREIVSRGMYFAYFKEYVHSITYMHRFLDKTMIEYHVKEGCTASIHYMVEKNQNSREEYVKEDMKDMFCGICVKQFVLFFGERLQYYIVEHEGDQERLTESGTISCNDMDEHDQNSKYSMINDIAIARTLGDYGTMDKLLLEYFQGEYLLNHLFSPAVDESKHCAGGTTDINDFDSTSQ